MESEEEAEVQVLVVSPRYWAVSALCYLDEPAKYFPAELCSYLNQFTQFYSHSKSPPLHQIKQVQLMSSNYKSLTMVTVPLAADVFVS